MYFKVLIVVIQLNGGDDGSNDGDDDDVCVCVLVSQSCLTLCNPMDCSTPGFPVHHQLLELAQTLVH